MGRIAILITPVVLFVLVMNGTINLNALKRNVQALPGKTIQVMREISSDIGDELSRRFPNLMKRRI